MIPAVPVLDSTLWTISICQNIPLNALLGLHFSETFKDASDGGSRAAFGMDEVRACVHRNVCYLIPKPRTKSYTQYLLQFIQMGIYS